MEVVNILPFENSALLYLNIDMKWTNLQICQDCLCYFISTDIIIFLFENSFQRIHLAHLMFTTILFHFRYVETLMRQSKFHTSSRTIAVYPCYW